MLHFQVPPTQDCEYICDILSCYEKRAITNEVHTNQSPALYTLDSKQESFLYLS